MSIANMRNRPAPRAGAWLSPCLLVSLYPCLLVSLSPCLACAQVFDEVIDSPMYQDPELPVPRLVPVFPEKAKGLWLKALERPEADLRRQAADAITLAHQRGFKGMETTIPALLAALDRPDQHPTVRLAIAKALFSLDARQAAARLLQQAEAGGDLGDLVEPALAAWTYRPAAALWLARLGDPGATQRGLILAVRGLGAVREEKATDRLRALALSEHTPVALRVEAARALGLLRDA